MITMKKNNLTDRSVCFSICSMQRQRKLHSREKIINTACDLFYRQGYHRTGINQIIEESGVAKATFYNHFKSKEELCLEYLRERDRIDTNANKDIIRGIDDPYEKYMSLIKGLKDYMIETDFRGCAFSNIAVEITEPNSPIRKEVKHHDDAYRSILRDVITDLKNSGPKYKDIDVEDLVSTYELIVGGALVLSKNYNDTWPIDKAISAVKKLVE